MRLLVLVVLAVVFFVNGATPAAAQQTPIRIILDTDLGPDADDAGALAVAHALANKGEATLLGVMCSTTSPWCAPCADAINTYYGRAEVPVGTLKGPGFPGGSEDWYGDSFNGYIAGHFPNRLQHAEHAPNALHLYRRLLAQQPDTSVAIVVVGMTTNLRDLLVSPPDTISALSGKDLVTRKVKLLSVMGGRYPAGLEFNFELDAAATRHVLNEWPTPIMFSGFEIGEEILTGARLFTETPPENPVRAAYHLWDLHFARRFEPDFDPSTGIWPHSSFDQTAILYAVHGLRDYWTAQTTGRNVLREDGSNEWRSTPDSEHAYLKERMPREEVARVIEDLMVAPPRK